MGTYFLWGSIAIILIVLVSGFLVGLYRGLKRSSLHVLFVAISVILAYFLTKPITNAILQFSFTISGTTYTLSEYIIYFISTNVIDLTNFETASSFIAQLPTAILNPIVFLVITSSFWFVLEMVYLVVARVSFGSKKKDFEEHKPRRIPAGFIGMAEAFLFMIVLLAPVVSLTNTYQDIAYVETAEVTTTATSDSGLQKISTIINDNIPSAVNEAIYALNSSPLGVICNAGGFGDAMFDGLSNFKINGETINIRKELVTLTSTYDNFVDVYNTFTLGDYDNLDVSALAENLRTLIDNNLFRQVVVTTLADVIQNYETTFADLNITLSATATDILDAVALNFEDENFDFYEYITNDLNYLIDIVCDLTDDGTLQALLEMDTTSLYSILDTVYENNTAVTSSLKTVLTLNTVTDALPTLIDMASSYVEELLANDESELYLTLNNSLSKTEVKEVVNSLSTIIDEVKELNDTADIISLLSADDILVTILNLDDISEVLTDLGSILDELNELAIFTYTPSDTDEEVNVFENILSAYGIDVLGDRLNNGTQIKTYTAFFSHIATPIQSIVDNNLTDIISSDNDFDIDLICACLESDETYLATILMPFYELSNANFNGTTLKELVFDTVIETLDENLSSYVTINTGDNTYTNWSTKLSSLSRLMKSLTGEYSEDTTYLDYLLAADSDAYTLVKKMNTDSTLSTMLNILFTNDMYAPLQATIFTNIDTQIANVTGVSPATTYTNLADNSELYTSTLCSLLDSIDTLSSSDIPTLLKLVGGVLDTLKTSGKQGVLNEVFVNLIWYLTGDVIDTSASQYLSTASASEGQTSTYLEPENDYYKKIKKYFAVADYYITTTGDDSYYAISYTDKMGDIADIVELAQNIDTALNGTTLTAETAATYINSITSAINKLYTESDTTSADKWTDEQVSTAVEVITNAKGILDDYISSDDIQSYNDTLYSQIEASTTLPSKVKSALESMLGLTEPTQAGG